MPGPKPQAQIDIFWSHVEKTETCWLWRGARTQQGYGVFTYTIAPGQRNTMGAHRFALFIKYGMPIPDFYNACHTCDTPACVRPDHLFLGTTRDNALDASRKGRLAFGNRNGASTKPWRVRRGETVGTAKLTAEAVKAIRAASASGTTGVELAEAFHVSPSQISNIIRGNQWKE